MGFSVECRGGEGRTHTHKLQLQPQPQPQPHPQPQPQPERQSSPLTSPLLTPPLGTPSDLLPQEFMGPNGPNNKAPTAGGLSAVPAASQLRHTFSTDDVKALLPGKCYFEPGDEAKMLSTLTNPTTMSIFTLNEVSEGG